MAAPGGIKTRYQKSFYDYDDYRRGHIILSELSTPELYALLRTASINYWDPGSEKEIKDELSTREHLRTKAQAKLDRKKVQKSKQNR